MFIPRRILQFIEGLKPTVMNDVLRVRTADPTRYATLSLVADLADSFGRSERARAQERKARHVLPPVRGKAPALAVEHTPSTETVDSGSILPITGGAEVDMIDVDNSKSEADSDWIESLYESTLQSQEVSAAEVNAVAPVVTNHNPRQPQWAQPERPGWLDARQASDEIARRINRGLVCHLCLAPDHFLSDCDKSPSQAKPLVRKRLPLLREDVRAKLPRFTYIVAGLTPPDKSEDASREPQKN